MKVLLVTEDLPTAQPGGAACHALMLGRALESAGHAVEVLGQKGRGESTGEGLQGPFHARIDLSGTGWQAHRFGAFLPGRGRHVAARIRRAISALGAHRFDVIHYHGHAHALGAMSPRRWPLVQTVHDQGSECLVRIRLREGQPCRELDPKACADCAVSRPAGPTAAWRRVLGSVAARTLRHDSLKSFCRHETIFVSEFLRRRFQTVIGSGQTLRASVVHNFIDASQLQAAARSASPCAADAVPVALAVARLDEGKGVGAWLEALDETVLRRFQVRVVGDGPLRQALQQRHGPRGVEFLGHLPAVQVQRLTADATLCVVPSMAEESFSLAALEAIALGRPTFALARGGLPELRRYERYPGQLVLAADHRHLAALLAAASRGLRARPAPPSEPPQSADVRARLPEVLAVYARAGERTAMGQAVHSHA